MIREFAKGTHSTGDVLQKGDKNWYPKLGCMVKVPVAFDPARYPAPPIEGGCAQCRCKNMAIDCTLATQNHPDGEVVERFPPPKIKVSGERGGRRHRVDPDGFCSLGCQEASIPQGE